MSGLDPMAEIDALLQQAGGGSPSPSPPTLHSERSASAGNHDAQSQTMRAGAPSPSPSALDEIDQLLADAGPAGEPTALEDSATDSATPATDSATPSPSPSPLLGASAPLSDSDYERRLADRFKRVATTSQALGYDQLPSVQEKLGAAAQTYASTGLPKRDPMKYPAFRKLQEMVAPEQDDAPTATDLALETAALFSPLVALGLTGKELFSGNIGGTAEAGTGPSKGHRDAAAAGSGGILGTAAELGGGALKVAGLRAVGNFVQGIGDDNPSAGATVVTKIGQISSTLQRPQAAFARDVFENVAAGEPLPALQVGGHSLPAAAANASYALLRNAANAWAAEAKAAGGRIDPETKQPFKAKTAREIWQDVVDAADPTPDTRRADVSWIDVARAGSIAAGGTGDEMWVIPVGVVGDLVLDPLAPFSMGPARLETRVGRVRGLQRILEDAYRGLGGKLAEDVETRARRVTQIVQRRVGQDLVSKVAEIDPRDHTEVVARAFDRWKVKGEQEALQLAEAGDKAGAAAATRRAAVAERAADRTRALSESLMSEALQANPVPFLPGADLARAATSFVVDRFWPETRVARWVRQPLSVDLAGLDFVEDWKASLRHTLGKEMRGVQQLQSNLTTQAPMGASFRYRQMMRVAARGTERMDHAVQMAKADLAAIAERTGRDVEDLEPITRALDAPHAAAYHVNFALPEGHGLAEDTAKDVVRSARLFHAKALVEAGSKAAAETAYDEHALPAILRVVPLPDVPELEQALLAKMARVDDDIAQLQQRVAGVVERAGGRAERAVAGATQQAGRIQQRTHGMAEGAVDQARVVAQRRADRAITTLQERRQRLADAAAVLEERLGRPVRSYTRAVGEGLATTQGTETRIAGGVQRDFARAQERMADVFAGEEQRVAAVGDAAAASVRGAVSSLGQQAEARIGTAGERMAQQAAAPERRALRAAERKTERAWDAVLDLVAQGRRKVGDDWLAYDEQLRKLDEGQAALMGMAQEKFAGNLKLLQDAGVDVGELDSYLPHVNAAPENLWRGRAFNPTPSGSIDIRKERTNLALEENQIAKLDPITNILHLMAANDWATQTILRREAFKSQVVKRFGIAVKKGQRFDSEIYGKFTHMGKEYAIPKDVEDALIHIQKLWTPTAIENPVARNVLRFYDDVLGIWKVKALNKPGYVTRNVFGNLALMQAGGMKNWGNFFTAINIGLQGHTRDAARAEIVRLVRQGASPQGAQKLVAAKVGQAEKIRRVVVRSKKYFAEQAEKRAGLGHLDVHQRRWTEKELYDVFERLGVIDRGYTTIDLARGTAEDFTTRKSARAFRQVYNHLLAPLNVFGSQHVLAQMTGAAAQGMDNLGRLAFATDRVLAHGVSPEEAARDVAKYLFNYKDLTKFDRGMKRVVPFYTWLRKNLPLQLELAIRKPRVFSIPYKVGRAFDRRYRQQVQGQAELLGKDVPWQARRYQGMRIGPQDAQALRGMAEAVLPEFLASRMVPDEKELDGLVMLTPDVPWNQPNDLMVWEGWEGPASMLAPIARTAFEAATHFELRPGFRPLVEEPLPGALQGAGEQLQALFPNGVWRSKTTGLWVAEPVVLRTMKASQPDLSYWEKLLMGPVGKAKAEQALRQRRDQKLRVTSEMTGAVRTMVLDPRQERNRAFAKQVGALEDEVNRRKGSVGELERRPK